MEGKTGTVFSVKINDLTRPARVGNKPKHEFYYSIRAFNIYYWLFIWRPLCRVSLLIVNQSEEAGGET